MHGKTSLKLKAEYTWERFREWMALRYPGKRANVTGCVKELLSLFRAVSGLRERLIADIRRAPGDRAMAIYCARQDGWWPAEDCARNA